MMEQWNEYKTDEIPIGKYEVIELVQNLDGTKIVLESENHKLIIKFEFTDAVRICDEGRRIRTYNDTEGIQSYRKDFYGIPLYQISNSEFCKWIIQESTGFYTDFIHYVIITINDIVDIISSLPPEIYVNDLY